MTRLSATFRIGALEVAALSDGAPARSFATFFVGAETAEWTAALGITDPQQPLPFNFGSFLIRGDGHITLIDTGYGAILQGQQISGGGALLLRIKELGVELSDIDRVIHTHLHHDHIGWNIVAGTGSAPTFANATHYVSRTELDYWMNAATDPASAGVWDEARALQTLLAERLQARVQPLIDAGRLETTDGEESLTPAVSMVPTPGHTPGHSSIMVRSQGEHLIVTGDVAEHPLHLEQHGWIPHVDMDPVAAGKSRTRLVELAIAKNAVVTGGHFPILTLGRLQRTDAGYRWLPL